MPNSTLDDENEQILKFNQSYDQYTQYLEVVKKLKYAINLSSGDNVSVVVQQLLTKNYSLIDAVLKESSASFKKVQDNFSKHIRNTMDNIPENRDKVKVVEILLTEAAKHDENLLPDLLKIQDQYGGNLFSLMVSYGTSEELESLVDMSTKYITPTLFEDLLSTKNENGETLLHKAAWAESVEKTQILVELGANINAKDKYNCTALHVASLANNPLDLMELLLESGANINAQDHKGFTALHIASAQGKMDLMELLLESGADPDITNNKQMTAEEIALKNVSDQKDQEQIKKMFRAAKEHLAASKKVASIVVGPPTITPLTNKLGTNRRLSL